jgi:protein MpaA
MAATTSPVTAPPTFAPTGSGVELVPYRPLDLAAEIVELGRSVQGAPITAERSGTPGGRRVLVIGVIHGNEAAGALIVDQLRSGPTPDGVELWLVDSMNPDGQAADDRHNANQVDLNRNFPYKWQPLAEPGDGQYAGPGPASEPETQAMVNFIAQLRPDIVIWYHQDLFVISPSEGREGRVRARYSELTGIPLGGITGGTYTGIAATWARTELAPDDSVAFIVELGEALSPDEAAVHADAVRTIAVEG